jgi:hypothetical protein
MTGTWALCSGSGILDAAAPKAQGQVGVDILEDRQWALLVRNERGELERLYGYSLSGVYQILGFIPGAADAGTADADVEPPTSGPMASVRFGDGYHTIRSYDSPRRLWVNGSIYVPMP